MTSFFSFRKSKEKQDSQALFNNWVTKIIKSELPDSSIIAINFGLFESDKGFQLYLAGFKDYDKDNDDWATGLGDFSPNDKYFKLPDNDFKELEWDSVQAKVADLIKGFMTTDSYKGTFLDKAMLKLYIKILWEVAILALKIRKIIMGIIHINIIHTNAVNIRRYFMT